MNNKRKLLRLSIFVFMVIALSITTSQTWAYWAEPTDAIDTATAIVDTGDWQQAFPFDSNYSYSIGDWVSFNGSLYEAKNSGTLREPGSAGYRKDWNDL